jgi:hypothetical protein
MKIKTYKQFNEDAVSTASTGGAGGVSNAQPGALPGTTAEPGSGDITSYLFDKKGKKIKKGKPSEVSDMRFLEPAKGITKVKESINEKGNLDKDQIHIINESLRDLYDIEFELTTLESDNYDDVEPTQHDIRISLHKMINVIWTGNMTVRCEFDKNEIIKKRIRTLRGSGSKLTTDEQELTDLVDDISHTLINMLGYTKGYFDISYLVAGSAMPYNNNRNINVNIQIGLSR